MGRILTLLLVVLVCSCKHGGQLDNSTTEEEAWIVSHRSEDGMLIVDSISESNIVRTYIDTTKSTENKYHWTSDTILYRYTFFKDGTMRFFMDSLNRNTKLIWGKNVHLHSKTRKGDRTELGIIVSRPYPMADCSYIYATKTDKNGSLDTIADKYSSKDDVLWFKVNHEKVQQFDLHSYVCGTYTGQISIEL